MTATKTKPPDVLAELAKLETAHAERARTASSLGTKHGLAVKRAEALHDARRRLVHRQPGLVDHTGLPLEKGNPVAKIDAELVALGDLDDLLRQRDHCRRLEEVARLDCKEFRASNFEAVLAAYEPAAEAAREKVQSSIAATITAAGDYRGMVDKCAALVAANPNVDARGVVALDPISDLIRSLRGRELPLPTAIR